MPLRAINFDSLQGQWEFFQSERDCPPLPEEYSPPFPDDDLLIISHDTIARFQFPNFLLSREKYRMENGKLFSDSTKFYAIAELDSGILKLHMRDCYVLLFKRVELNSESMKTISVLLHDTINPVMMLGKLTMVTHFVPDDEAAYDFYPPVKMPDAFWISDTNQALEIYRSGVIYLQAGTKVRPFNIAFINFDLSWYAHRSDFYSMYLPYVILTPGQWWTGESFEVRYEMKETDWVRAHH